MIVHVPSAVLRHAATAALAVAGTWIVAVSLGAPADGIPDAVRAVFTHHSRGANLEAIEQEHEDGLLVWVAEWEADGREHEIKVLPDGEVLEKEYEIIPREVPERVRQAAVAATTGRIVEWKRKTVTVYEATALIDDDDHDIEIRATGVLLGSPGKTSPKSRKASKSKHRFALGDERGHGDGRHDDDGHDDDDGDDGDDDWEEEIPLDEVPEAVMAAALRALPGAVFEEAERELERGRLVYELEGTHEGERVEIELTEDGEVLEIERGDDDDDDD